MYTPFSSSHLAPTTPPCTSFLDPAIIRPPCDPDTGDEAVSDSEARSERSYRPATTCHPSELIHRHSVVPVSSQALANAYYPPPSSSSAGASKLVDRYLPVPLPRPYPSLPSDPLVSSFSPTTLISPRPSSHAHAVPAPSSQSTPDLDSDKTSSAVLPPPARRMVDMNMAPEGSLAAQPGFQTPLAAYAGGRQPFHSSLNSKLFFADTCPSANSHLAMVWIPRTTCFSQSFRPRRLTFFDAQRSSSHPFARLHQICSQDVTDHHGLA